MHDADAPHKLEAEREDGGVFKKILPYFSPTPFFIMSHSWNEIVERVLAFSFPCVSVGGVGEKTAKFIIKRLFPRTP